LVVEFVVPLLADDNDIIVLGIVVIVINAALGNVDGLRVVSLP
jgi:hypothetical protein